MQFLIPPIRCRGGGWGEADCISEKLPDDAEVVVHQKHTLSSKAGKTITKIEEFKFFWPQWWGERDPWWAE